MSAADPQVVIAAAHEWLGTPYHDQASLRGVGADCLGLARGIWRDVVGPEPTEIPPYSRDWGEVGDREVMADTALEWMPSVPLSEIAPGDLVLFRMRRGAIAKHCGILISEDRFIHAYDRLGVVVDHLHAGWSRRIAYAFRYPKEAP